jgi:hypothetical protein
MAWQRHRISLGPIGGGEGLGPRQMSDPTQDREVLALGGAEPAQDCTATTLDCLVIALHAMVLLNRKKEKKKRSRKKKGESA